MPEQKIELLPPQKRRLLPPCPVPFAVGVLWGNQGCAAIPRSLNTPKVELLGPGAEERPVVPLSLPLSQ